MGAYGTPDTYPYEEIERKCSRCGKSSKGEFCCYCGFPLSVDAKQGYKSMYSIILIVLSAVLLGMGLLMSEKTIPDILFIVWVTTLFYTAGNLLGAILCKIKKVKNKRYITHFLCAMLISVAIFVVFIMTA